MIRRLTILLLIVGCAHKPPTASFYIGMTEEEFVDNNPHLMGKSSYIKIEGVMPIIPKVEIPEQPEPPQTEDE